MIGTVSHFSLGRIWPMGRTFEVETKIQLVRNTSTTSSLLGWGLCCSICSALTNCCAGLGCRQVSAVSDSKHVWILVMLESVFVDVQPAGLVGQRTGFNDRMGPHWRCNMKHFILRRNKKKRHGLKNIDTARTKHCNLHFTTHDSYLKHCGFTRFVQIFKDCFLLVRPDLNQVVSEVDL